MNLIQAIPVLTQGHIVRNLLANTVAKSCSAISIVFFWNSRIIISAQERADDRNVARCEGVVYRFFTKTRIGKVRPGLFQAQFHQTNS